MTEIHLALIEHQVERAEMWEKPWEWLQDIRDLCAEVRKLRAREDAVFAKGYRGGYFDGSHSGTSPFQDEVDLAHAAWVDGGRRTHLEEDADDGGTAFGDRGSAP